MLVRTIIFLILNFAALGFGSFFTSKGVPSDWYAALNKAPWTPPGWFFGFAWTSIMICFSIYLAKLWPLAFNKKELLLLYVFQWLLNVSWNPTFFYFQEITGALVLIVLLTILVIHFLIHYWKTVSFYSLFVLPYALWLCIAVSLNLYILLRN